MYFEQSIAIDRHAERLQRAQDERLARSAVVLSRLKRRQARAERELVSAWRRVDQLRSALESVG